MEINNFVNMDFLAGFAGTIVGVELIVYCTKEISGIKKIPTRIYTFMLALIHLLIVKMVTGTLTFNVGNVYLLVINSLLISVILCGGYDVVIGNVQIPQITNSKKQDVTIKINPDSENEEITISKENNDSETNDVKSTNVENNNEEAIASLSNRGRNSNINDREI